MMSKCISCSCTQYKSPTQPKSTLLQLRQHCQECGHQASEHRRLTAVDQFIKSEVAKGKRSRCQAHIFPSEIPMSPVFSRYDLIPLPRDDSSCAPSMENSVECTCKGFKTTDVIRLCQKFRTFKLRDVAVELKEIPCTFCNHPLSSHTVTPGQDGSGGSTNSSAMSTKKPALGVYEGLALTRSSLLAFPPINSDCLELILPANFEDAFMLLTVGKFQDCDMLMMAIANEALNPTSHFNMEESPSDTLGKEPCGDDLVAVSRKRARGKQASAASKRRSRRVASKKAKEEQAKVLKQLKGLKGIGRVPVPGMDCGVEEMDLVEYTEMDYKQVLQTTDGLIQKIDARDNYHTYFLPQELLADDVEHPVMASLRISQRVSAQDSDQDSMETDQDRTPSGIVVAVGAKESSDVFVAVLHAEEGCSDAVLNWHQMQCPGLGTLCCLLVWEVMPSQGEARAGEVLVAAGMSSGVVCVWKAVLAEGRVKGTVVVAKFNCGCQCIALSCSPDSKFLVAGTVLGEAVFCPLTLDGRSEEPTESHLHTIKCCGAPVQCITWSDDGRLLAVGACDDTIQVLQCVTPHTAEPAHKGSLFNYFKRTDGYRQPKVMNIYTLKGHTSFIADLRFTHGYFLVSLGWDGQLLFWRLRPIPDPDQLDQGRLRRSRARSEIQPELMDPVGGYKLGPSLVVEFLPLLLRSVVGCGLVVAMANKLGGVTVAGYAKPCQ